MLPVPLRRSASYTLLPLRGTSPIGKRVTGFSVAVGSLRIPFPCHLKGKQGVEAGDVEPYSSCRISAIPPLVAGATTFPGGKHVTGFAGRGAPL
jgi:hypothetical protein